VDVVIARTIEAGIGHVELVNSLFEPRVVGGGVGGQAPATTSPEYLQTRAALRQWRLTEILSGGRCERAVNPGNRAQLHAANRRCLARRRLRAKPGDRKRERNNRKTSEFASR